MLAFSGSHRSGRHYAEVVFNALPIARISLLAMLVGLGRLELPTSPLSGVRSNHLSYRPILLQDGLLVSEPVELVELIGIEPTAS